MTKLRVRMYEDLQLRGFAETTQEAYVGAVKGLANYYDRSPSELTEEELRHYFLYLVNERQVAASTFTIHISGIKFFFETTLEREWKIFGLVRPKKRKKLPVVLSLEEVRHLLSLIKSPIPKMALTLIYSCGLRLSEATHMKLEDIDSERMQVLVRNGKGGKDRSVPLPEKTLKLLRSYYRLMRPQPYLFTKKTGTDHIPNNTVQRTLKAVLRQSGIKKNASVHSLRHSYATHLHENGVSLRTLQELLGHKSPTSTALYTHLTQTTMSTLTATINHLMADL